MNQYMETSDDWMDFSAVEIQDTSFSIIPRNTIARVCMTIKPGGYDDPNKGWAGGYATRSISGAVYLSCEFTILDGPYANRKVWSLIGLHSPKGPAYENMGRMFIKTILNSARGFTDADNSAEAMTARKITGFKDLDRIEFVALIEVEKNQQTGEERNVIKKAVTKDHKDYLSGVSKPQYQQAPNNIRPTWAK